MEWSITPKAHVLFDHTMEQVIKFNADKVEAFIERTDQIGLKLDHYTARLKNNRFKNKHELQIKKLLLHHNNDICKWIIKARKFLKRKFQHLHFKQQTFIEKRQCIRIQQRQK